MSPDSGGCYSSDNIEVNPSDQGGCYDTINSDPYSSSMITFFSYWYRLIMIPRYKSFTHHPFNHPSFDRTLTWYSRLRLVYIVTKTNRIHNRLWVAFKLYVPSLLYSPFWIATSSWQLFCGNRIREGITLLTVSSSSSSLLDSISSDSFSILDRFFCKITIFISSATIHVHFFEFDLRIGSTPFLMYVSAVFHFKSATFFILDCFLMITNTNKFELPSPSSSPSSSFRCSMIRWLHSVSDSQRSSRPYLSIPLQVWITGFGRVLFFRRYHHRRRRHHEWSRTQPRMLSRLVFDIEP